MLCLASTDGAAARPVNTRCFFEISIDGKVAAARALIYIHIYIHITAAAALSFVLKTWL
jgi:hypothetical protein